MRLTERKIEQMTVKPGQRDRLIFDDAQRGLAVRITASGGRTYLAQYTLERFPIDANRGDQGRGLAEGATPGARPGC